MHPPHTQQSGWRRQGWLWTLLLVVGIGVAWWAGAGREPSLQAGAGVELSAPPPAVAATAPGVAESGRVPAVDTRVAAESDPAGRPQVMAPPPGLAMRGVVLSALDGKPLAGAEVDYHGPTSLQVGDGVLTSRTETDDRGRFEWRPFPLLALASTENDTIQLRIRAEGFLTAIARQPIRVTQDGADLGIVRLAPASLGRVDVVDESDAPVVGARVHCTIRAGGSAVSVRTYLPAARTDADGHASFWLPDQGAGSLDLWVEKDGWIPAQIRNIGIEKVRVRMRRGRSVMVDLEGVPAGVSPEVRVDAKSMGLMVHTMVPPGQSSVALPDVLGADAVEVRAEVTAPDGYFTASARLSADVERCALRFSRMFASIPVQGPRDAMMDLTLGIYVRKFGRGPLQFRESVVVSDETGSTTIMPRVVGDVFVAAWSPRAGFLRPEAPCKHTDAAGIQLVPRHEETVACNASVCYPSGMTLAGAQVELLVALPAHWTCDTGKPASMRVSFRTDSRGCANIGLLPRTYVEGVLLVTASGSPARIVRASVTPDLRLVAVGR
jgi:hypothetical protein